MPTIADVMLRIYSRVCTFLNKRWAIVCTYPICTQYGNKRVLCNIPVPRLVIVRILLYGVSSIP